MIWKSVKILIGILVILGLGFTLFEELGMIPAVKATKGDELSTSTVNSLLKEGIIEPNENIHFFYSEDLFSFTNYGNLFTDKRIISYETDEDTDERTIFYAEYDEVSDIKFKASEEALEDSMIHIYVNGVHGFSLLVSNEDDGDKLFYKSLVKLWIGKISKKPNKSLIPEPESGAKLVMASSL